METNAATTERNVEEVTRQKLLRDMKVVLHDAEALIIATAGDISERTKEARVRLGAALERAKESCHKMEAKAIASAKATDRIIREHPYQSIGLAFGLGLLVGVLVNRK